MPLKPSVRDLSVTGLLTIEFTNKMRIPPFLESKSELIKLDDFIYVHVVSSFHDYDSEEIEIKDYRIVSYIEKRLQLQIDFLKPNYLSLDL